MTDKWFHRRSDSEGTGYGVKSRKGVVAAVVLIGLVMAVVIGAVEAAVKWHVPPFSALVTAIAVSFLLIIGFVGVVVRKSDRR